MAAPAAKLPHRGDAGNAAGASGLLLGAIADDFTGATDLGNSELIAQHDEQEPLNKPAGPARAKGATGDQGVENAIRPADGCHPEIWAV